MENCCGPDVFNVVKDRYLCVTIDSKKVKYKSDEEFLTKLKASLNLWREEGVLGVWVRVNIAHASLIPLCTQVGFSFHHTKPSYLTLKQWLQDDIPDTLPDYANQYLGCGGFVLNEQNQLLVVKEKYSDKPHWKLPGGHAELGEEIGDAARREVLEETGVKCEFESVICFRHQHQYRYGCSDFYFICLMRPLTSAITKCDHEIAEARWMDLYEYVNHPAVTEANRYFASCYLNLLEQGHRSTIQAGTVLSYMKDRNTAVYSIQPPRDHAETDNVVNTSQSPL